MRRHTAESIERDAEEVLRQAGALSVPIDLNRVANSLFVKVHQEQMEDRVSGALIVKGGERHIIVNRAHHPNRQRFTTAHELGHLVLHDDTGDKLFIDEQLRVYQRVGEASSTAYKQSNSTTDPRMEWEANMFAAALLMPASLLRHAALGHNLWDEHDIEALAGAFGVSAQAMSIRLQQLHVVQVALWQQPPRTEMMVA